MNDKQDKLLTALGVTARIAAIVGFVELAIICVSGLVGSQLDSMHRILFDTVLLAVFSTPPIFYLVVKPFVLARDRALLSAQFLALHDPLTQLPNRRLIYQHIDKCLSSFPRYGQFGALIYFDLDGFKAINDEHGHRVGDAVLVQIAERLKKITRSEDVACRLGGDEFVVLIQNLGNDEGIARQKIGTIAFKIGAVVRKPVDVKGLRLQVGCSTGVRLLCSQRATAADALRDADTAMYYAKKTAPGAIVFSDQIELSMYGIVPIGVEEIDREHAEIEALIEEGISKETGKLGYVRRICTALSDHFRTEQLTSRRLVLNFTSEHGREHGNLIRLLGGISDRATEESAHRDLLSIRNMIDEHVAEFDRELLHAEPVRLATESA